MNIDNIFDEISFFGEAGIDNFNIEHLKELGDITHIKKEKDNFITEIIEFVSFDKSISFTKTYTYFKEDEKLRLKEQLQKELSAAIHAENYELAQKLKEERDRL